MGTLVETALLPDFSTRRILWFSLLNGRTSEQKDGPFYVSDLIRTIPLHDFLGQPETISWKELGPSVSQIPLCEMELLERKQTTGH
jgi:hypothetical protein